MLISKPIIIYLNDRFDDTWIPFLFVITSKMPHVCYLGCSRIRTHDMLIIDISVIGTGTDSQTFLIQLLAMFAE